MYSITNIIIQAAINGFGTDTAAAWASFGKLDALFWTVNGAFGIAITTFAGQNYGAGKKDRIKSGYHISIRLLICWAALITIAFVFFPRQISVLFFHEEEVIRLSVDYLRIIGFSEIFLSVEMMTVGALSGLGRTQLCSLISVGLTVIRIPLALVLSNTALGLNGIWWALTLSTVSKGIIFYFVFQYICEHSLLRTTNR